MNDTNDLFHLIRLLCEHPELSTARIGRVVKRSARTVARYRKEIAARDLTWAHFEGLTADELDRVFNQPRYRPPSKTPHDPVRVANVLARPKATLRDAWEDYRASAPRPHIAYDTFRRRVGLTLVRRFVEKGSDADAGPEVPFVTNFVPLVDKSVAKTGGDGNDRGRAGSAATPDENGAFEQTGESGSRRSCSAARELAEPKISAIRVGRPFEGTRND